MNTLGQPQQGKRGNDIDADVIVVGAGLAGLAAAAEAAEAGRTVLLLDQEPEASLGGQAWWSFGGLFFVHSPEQRRLRIRDSLDLAWQDWTGTAGFGRPEHVDGRMIEITEQAGGQVINRDRMWHYVEGITNWNPVWPLHGIRILPGPSALWLDATGRRLPGPLYPGFDTLGTLAYLRGTGHDHSWLVLTRKIIAREFALSGSEQNPDLTGPWRARSSAAACSPAAPPDGPPRTRRRDSRVYRPSRGARFAAARGNLVSVLEFPEAVTAS